MIQEEAANHAELTMKLPQTRRWHGAALEKCERGKLSSIEVNQGHAKFFRELAMSRFLLALLLCGAISVSCADAYFVNGSCGVGGVPVYFTPPAQPYYTPPAMPFYTPPATPFYTPPAMPFYTPPATPFYTPPATPFFQPFGCFGFSH